MFLLLWWENGMFLLLRWENGMFLLGDPGRILYMTTYPMVEILYLVNGGPRQGFLCMVIQGSIW